MSEFNASLSTHESLLLLLKAEGSQREIAWNEFCARYAPIIAGFARKMNARPSDIADLVQEVLLGFVSAAPTFVYDRTRGRFRGYLKACTWRVCRKHLAAQQIDGRRYESIDPDDLAVERVWNDVWDTEKLHRALDLVRQRYEQRDDTRKTFEAFQQYVLLDRAADEVAAGLGMSVSSVYQAKTRVSRSIAQAMQELDEAMG